MEKATNKKCTTAQWCELQTKDMFAYDLMVAIEDNNNLSVQTNDQQTWIIVNFIKVILDGFL
jgi:hypothetical protein